MPYFTSIHLAFKTKDLPEFEKAFGYTYENNYNSHSYTEPTDCSKEKSLEDEVHNIMKDVFEKTTNSKFINTEGSSFKHYIFDTPLGRREMIFNFGYKNRNFEGGYTESQDLIGIEIFGRYYPCFIDWEYKHGGMDETGLMDITEKMEMINELKSELVKFNSFFSLLRIYLKEDFA